MRCRLRQTRQRLVEIAGLDDLWRRTGWAPSAGAIEDELRPIESAASSTVRDQLRRLQSQGLEAWLAATAVRQGVTTNELRTVPDGKVARWSSPRQPLPEIEFLIEGLAHAIWQYEELARRVSLSRCSCLIALDQTGRLCASHPDRDCETVMAAAVSGS